MAKRCRVCDKHADEWDVIYTTTQRECSIKCAIAYSKTEKGKKEISRKKGNELRKRKQKLKSKSKRMSEVEAACRRFRRAEERLYYLRRGQLPQCISCGTSKQVQYCGGHYKTVGSHPELRITEINIHLQCNRRCNKELSGNINGTKDTHGYSKGLAIRYGQERAQEIISELNSYHPPLKLSDDEMKEKKAYYNKMARELEYEIKKIACTE